MRRKQLIGIAVAIVVAVVIYESGLFTPNAPPKSLFGDLFMPASTPTAAAPQKPICSQIIVPAGDCIPQHLAHLPPDPGPAGMRTLEGIDSDKDGVRDDVQRFIVEQYGSSQRAVKGLTLVAKHAQEQVMLGGTVTKDEAQKIAQKTGADLALCFIASGLSDESARAVTNLVTNTPGRLENYRKFDTLLAFSFFLASTASVVEACGYDPASLPN